ncbi:MAG: pyridoxal-phosphate dependent enzyme, partial [Sphingopyxis sp.]
DAAIHIAEPAGWDDMGQSLRAGTIIPVGENPPHTACDALQTLCVAPQTFAILAQRGAAGCSVTEKEVRDAMRVAQDRLRLVVEPGGAVALAAMIAGRVPAGATPLITLSGGNVDRAAYADILARDD